MENQKKMVNAELLRMVSMLLVIVLHLLGKSDLLPNMPGNSNVNTYLAWILESCSIVAVNLYMLISGYFMVKGHFRTGRLLSLVAQVIFYTIGVLGLVTVFNLVDVKALTIYDIILNLFPIHFNQYWFMSSYVLMYLFSPVLAIAARKMTKKQLGWTIILLLIFESVSKTVLPIPLDIDSRGYSATWYMMLFLVAAYIRLHGLKILEKPSKGILLYIVSVFLIFAEEIALQFVVEKTGHLKRLVGVSYHYNHLFVLTASLGLFCAFIYSKQITGVISKIILFLSPLSLGVYLFHEQMYIRYQWQKWFQAGNLSQAPWYLFIPAVLGIAICVYLIGSGVDFLRKMLFRLFKIFFDKIGVNRKLEVIDNAINTQADE